MVEIFKFILLYNFLLISFYFCGKLLVEKLLSKNLNESRILLSIPVNYFYFIVGFFSIGNCIFFLNFFTAINIYFLIILILSIIFWQIKFISEYFKFNIISIFSSIIFSISILNNNGSLDGYAYHFLNQNLIRNEKIIIGLGNFEPHYGIMSIFEYLSSVLWFENNFVYIQILNLIILSNFFNVLYGFLKSKNNLLVNISLFFLTIGFLDNFGFSGGRNGFYFIQEVGKFDSSFGIIYLISFILLYFSSKSYFTNDLEVNIFLISLTLLVQIRSFGYIMFLPFIILFFKYKNTFNLSIIFKNKIFFIVNILWIIKNILVTSCLIYPIQQTCLSSVKWSNNSIAEYLSRIGTANNRNPLLNNLDLNSFDWIRDYWITNNIDYLYNISLTFIFIFIILFVNKLISKSNDKIEYFSFQHILLSTYSLLTIIIWFLVFPNYRFLPGFVLSFYFVVFIRHLNINNRLLKNILNFNSIKFLIVIVVSMSIVRIDSYYSLNNFNTNFIERYKIPFQEYSIKTNSYGLEPIGFHCLINTSCTVSQQDVYLDYIYGYKIFIPYDKFYYSKILKQFNE